MDTHRAERVSEALRQELGEMIAYELADPRIGEAVVTEVHVSPDMRHARVRLHLEDDTRQQLQTIQALDGARHFLRRQLAERLNLFRVPELHFEADAGTSSAKIEHLLKRIRRGRPRDQERTGHGSAPPDREESINPLGGAPKP
jgi:ribosome-binding factor A